MRAVRTIFLVLCLVVMLAAAAPAAAKPDPGREILGFNDGWASEGAGTTGGVAATPDQVYIVHDRIELIKALNNGVYPASSSTVSNTPKIIYVAGTIDANVDDNNQPLTCQDYYRNGYTLEGFLAAFDPAVYGRKAPSGPMETARVASRAAQEARVRIRVGSNTTIVGVGKNAKIRGAWLDIRGTTNSNIIIRNITFQDVYDCFPVWSPTDGSLGAWNAAYDAISVREVNHVWIDHNTFEDVVTADATAPTYFGVHYEMHDGLVDITNASNFVTVSWNRFMNHDKVMLIGSSDSGSTAAGDVGKLKVTIHHNLFENLGQRTPRVRFGQVHVYNNLYNVSENTKYVYSWGVGKDSSIYAQNNYFNIPVGADKIIGVYSGTKIYAEGTYVNGHSVHNLVDVVALFNEVYDPDLSTDVGWVPTLHTYIHPTQSLPGLVKAQAGPFNW